MNRSNWTCLLTVAAALLTHSTSAQDPLRGVLTMGFGDVAAIKQKAEAGDAKAQVALADLLAQHFRSSEALHWYRTAADQGKTDAVYHVGRLLLFGGTGIPNSQTVQANPAEGIRWTFRAATNFHPNACWNMSKALQRGLGVSPNLIEAYAWLQLFADSPEGSILGRVELNTLALKLDSTALRQAQQLATQFKAGKWQRPVVRAIGEHDPRLKLTGIIAGGKTPLVVISGKTLAEGESVIIPGKPSTFIVRCLRIEKDSVLVAIDGEDAPRRLYLK